MASDLDTNLHLNDLGWLLNKSPVSYTLMDREREQNYIRDSTVFHKDAGDIFTILAELWQCISITWPDLESCNKRCSKDQRAVVCVVTTRAYPGVITGVGIATIDAYTQRTVLTCVQGRKQSLVGLECHL